jgi:hypothetical protein
MQIFDIETHDCVKVAGKIVPEMYLVLGSLPLSWNEFQEILNPYKYSLRIFYKK